MARMESPRIAVLGAGPVGLEAALYASALNLPFAVYERGRVGEHLRRWGHVRMFSPFGMNSTPLGRARIRADQPQHPLPETNAVLTGREHLAVYLEPLALAPALTPAIHENTTVLCVGKRGLLKGDYPGDARRGREPFRLLLRDDKGRERVEEADVVLDCTGVYSCPRRLGDGGIPAVGETAARPHIAWGLEDAAGERKSHYADKTTLVIGAGYSAATTVCTLAALAEKHPATWVIWLARGAGTLPIKRIVGDPLRERDLIAVRANNLATRPDGNVEFHAQTVVEAVETAGPDRGFKVVGRRAGKPVSWDVERVIANVGYSPYTELYRELQVQESGDSLRPTGPAPLRLSEPSFFILGAKSYGRDSNFLLRIGLEQVRDVFALIAGKPGLDLYKARAA
jgi:thioredoxin reductase